MCSRRGAGLVGALAGQPDCGALFLFTLVRGGHHLMGYVESGPEELALEGALLDPARNCEKAPSL